MFTRIVAFILSGEMAFAYFMGHMFKGGLAAPVFITAILLMFLVLVLLADAMSAALRRLLA